MCMFEEDKSVVEDTIVVGMIGEGNQKKVGMLEDRIVEVGNTLAIVEGCCSL